MPVIGVDCDITLQHPAVNGGQPCPFLLHPKAGQGTLVQVHHEVYSDTLGGFSDVRHLWFDVLIADSLINPDGSTHTQDAQTMYRNLVDIITQHRDITLTTRSGTITGLYALEHVMEHKIFTDGRIIVRCHLTTRSTHYQVNGELYFASQWVDEGSYSGMMNWDNSYWR
jgi:hypothetical protein